jgi:SAM-dependent methyltransferase
MPMSGGQRQWHRRVWLHVWKIFVQTCLAIGVPERGSISGGGHRADEGPQSAEYRWVASQLKEARPPDGWLLDLGCGEAYGLHDLFVHGHRAVGLDPSSTALELARGRYPNVDLIRASAEALPFKRNLFHAVVAIQSIEHTDDPAAVFRQIHWVLQEGGLILLTTPLANHEAALHSRFHTREFTTDELTTLLLSCGFIPEPGRVEDLTPSGNPNLREPVTARVAKVIHSITKLPTPLPPRETLLIVARRHTDLRPPIGHVASII